MNNIFISTCKTYINAGNLSEQQKYYDEFQHNDLGYNPNWEYIYHRLYLHACLKKQKAIVDWLKSLFTSLDPVSQIGLRQIFPYGRHLLSR